MKQILVTAFEPFGGSNVNTSARVLSLLPERIAGLPVRKRLLPVVFGRAAEEVLEQEASLIFLLGEAGGRDRVTPETRAVNLRRARIPDNAGCQPAQEPCLPGGPEEYRTPVPAAAITARMRQEGWPIALSEDAGTFVCNDTYYLVGVRSPAPAAFIHVPAAPEEARRWADTAARYMTLAAEACLLRTGAAPA